MYIYVRKKTKKTDQLWGCVEIYSLSFRFLFYNYAAKALIKESLYGQLNTAPKQNFTRNFYRLTGAARQKTAKQKTPEEITLKTTGETHGTQSKDDFNLESPSLKEK